MKSATMLVLNLNLVKNKEQQNMDIFTAVQIIEGEQIPESHEQYLEAAQALVDSGMAWILQGFFGRVCAELIQEGLIHPR